MPQISSHARGLLNNVFRSRLSFLALAGWFVRGLLFGSPPTRFLITLDKFRGKPYGKTALNATRLCHQTGIDGGMLFLPLRWTKRIAAAGQRRRSFLLMGTLFNLWIGIKCRKIMILETTRVSPTKGKLTNDCRGEPLWSPAHDVKLHTLFYMRMGFSLNQSTLFLWPY